MTAIEEFKAALQHPRFCYTRAKNPSHPSGAWQTTDDLWVVVYGFGDEDYKHATAYLPFNEAIPIMEGSSVLGFTAFTNRRDGAVLV